MNRRCPPRPVRPYRPECLRFLLRAPTNPRRSRVRRRSRGPHRPYRRFPPMLRFPPKLRFPPMLRLPKLSCRPSRFRYRRSHSPRCCSHRYPCRRAPQRRQRRLSQRPRVGNSPQDFAYNQQTL